MFCLRLSLGGFFYIVIVVETEGIVFIKEVEGGGVFY